MPGEAKERRVKSDLTVSDASASVASHLLSGTEVVLRRRRRSHAMFGLAPQVLRFFSSAQAR
jgi:hypothetical protein